MNYFALDPEFLAATLPRPVPIIEAPTTRFRRTKEEMEPVPAGATIREQHTRCGSLRCPLCGDDGPGHGPYLYAFWRDSKGRSQSRYLGKKKVAPNSSDAIE
jgi:hypothetical protein